MALPELSYTLDHFFKTILFKQNIIVQLHHQFAGCFVKTNGALLNLTFDRCWYYAYYVVRKMIDPFGI